MRDRQPSQLFTCRYWAFGAGCPNHDTNGVSICKFAHWDAGRLASSFDQRGTCKFWLRGTCRNGNNCFYEHRNTGVDSMYQGPISLTGINLEIANAAAKGGFNTWNHDALYDLIWSVRRLAFRHRRPEASRSIPKDPVYPDRFRPSGLGDNSKRKRKLQAPEPKTEEPLRVVDLIEPVKRTTRPFRYHNRRTAQHSLHTTNASNGHAGTINNPIDVMSDGEDDRTKRQRLNNGDVNSLRPAANQSRLRANAASFTPSARSYSRADVHERDSSDAGRNTSGGSFTQQDSFIRFSNATTSATNTTFAQRTISQNITELLTTPLDSLSNALIMVPSRLKDIAKLTETCRELMWSAFNDNEDMLNPEEVKKNLVMLNGHFESIEIEVKQGMDCFEHTKNVIQQLRGDSTDIS